jgi:hypothetical protein
MLAKKLLTLACAFGILAIGACFLPPARIPAPPLPPYLASVRTIAIQVEDASSNSLLNSDAMEVATASTFNRLWSEFPLRAEPRSASAPTDATLRIVLIGKSASLDRASGDRQLWAFQISTESTLIARDGRILWHQSDRKIHLVRWFNSAATPPSWNARELVHDIAYDLAMTSGDSMLFAHSLPHSQEQP